ncbi:hypothetical protein, partial [Achromobacter xylosoxidans]|uniref:hypothetical protein n=1 Tax=Alcaligenes xylosoxydans xylosoxydans TaxID=85698 RepID=UPI001A93E7D9
AGAGAGDQRNAGRVDLVRVHWMLLVICRRNATRIILAMVQANVPFATRRVRLDKHGSGRVRLDKHGSGNELADGCSAAAIAAIAVAN